MLKKNENDINMKLNKVYIDDINFSINKNFQPTSNEPIDLKCSFKREVIKMDEDNAAVVISFIINQASTKPFFGSLKAVGLFQLEKWESSEIKKDIIRINGASILFPYLRNAVSNITCLMDVPPYVLPVMNIIKLFNDDKREEDKKDG